MFRSAESVSPMHPDKICDRIADSILDEILKQDSLARVAIEVMGGHGRLQIMGEVTTDAKIDYEQVAKSIVTDQLEITTNIVQQSPEIARGVDTGGAGDQGVMIGYATAETKELIPKELSLSRQLNQLIYEQFPYDGKTQVTLKANEISAVVCSFQHASSTDLRVIVEDWLNQQAVADNIGLHINPAGDWDIGGFASDTGLTGRKLAVDNYGPHIPLGGGSYSGKDATKVDRSAAYMARRIAVDLLNKHGADKCMVYLAYSIGEASPVHAEAVLDGKSQKISGYDLSPNGIIEYLDLRKPQYKKTAEYGHYGNNFAWEN